KGSKAVPARHQEIADIREHRQKIAVLEVQIKDLYAEVNAKWDNRSLYLKDYALVSILGICGVVELVVRSALVVLLTISVVGVIPIAMLAYDGRIRTLLIPYCFKMAEGVLKGAYRRNGEMQ